MDKHFLLDKAVEITKAYGEGGYSGQTPAEVLDHLFQKLLELNKEVEKGS